ncbi:hypothetical protein RM023_03380 [Limosilactobacillus reuteri]|uniref:hypothetical protein n=1 Tax=Limosilactobacillus reuteri TaxID=1598 RepID=UPI0039BF18DF
MSFRGSKLIGREKHPFSVTSAPKNDPHEITFTIQKLGDFTKKDPISTNWNKSIFRRTIRTI